MTELKLWLWDFGMEKQNSELGVEQIKGRKRNLPVPYDAERMITHFSYIWKFRQIASR